MKNRLAVDMFEGNVGGVRQPVLVDRRSRCNGQSEAAPFSSRSRRAPTRLCSSSRWAAASSAALPSPMIAGTFSVPPRRPRSWWPPRISGLNFTPFARTARRFPSAHAAYAPTATACRSRCLSEVDRDPCRPPAPHRYETARQRHGPAPRGARPETAFRSRCWPT